MFMALRLLQPKVDYPHGNTHSIYLIMAYQAAWFAKKVARSNVPPYQPLMKASPHLREKSPIRQG